jgi:PAS domain-containing protein
MPVEILAALIAAFIAVLVSALYALRQRVGAAEARMELAQLGQKLKNIGTEVAGTIAQAEAERDAALAILDALPTPVWRRGADHALAYCNRAYAAAVGRDAEAVVNEATELPGKAQAGISRGLARRALESGEISSERLHVVVAGERRLMELFETPLSAKQSLESSEAEDGAEDSIGETAGMALDRTASEELQSELKRHIEAHAEVLETLGSGIAIFGPDMHLKFFNTAYARLLGLEEEALKGEPHLNDIHELLREQRRLPEQSDFPAYKRDQVRLFSTLIEPLEDLLHLPNGTTLRLTATPHPFGGVLMSFEDVTDRLALESSYNTLIAVQRETLDHLFEGVAVYGADGRLKLFNPVYARLWGLAASFLGGEPHMREVIPETRAYFNTSDGDWPALMERILGQSTEPNPRGRRRERADGSVVEWAQVPLPDGANLFTFLDVTCGNATKRWRPPTG